MANKTFHVFRGKAGHVQCSFKWISCFLKHCLWNSFAFIVNSIRTPRLAALTLRVKPVCCFLAVSTKDTEMPRVSPPPSNPTTTTNPQLPPLLLSPTHNHKHNKLMLTEPVHWPAVAVRYSLLSLMQMNQTAREWGRTGTSDKTIWVDKTLCFSF